MKNKVLSEHKVDHAILNLKTFQWPHILYTVKYHLLGKESRVGLSSSASWRSCVVCSSSCLSSLTTLCYFTPLSPCILFSLCLQFLILIWWTTVCPIKAKFHSLCAVFPLCLPSLLFPPVLLCNLLHIALFMKQCNYLKKGLNPATSWRYFWGHCV